MIYLAIDLDGSADIGPAWYLPDGQYISVAQRNVFGGITVENGIQRDLYLFGGGARGCVTRQIGFPGIRAAFQTAGRANQVRRMHVIRVRIASWLGDFAGNLHGAGIHTLRIAVNQQTIAWL